MATDCCFTVVCPIPSCVSQLKIFYPGTNILKLYFGSGYQLPDQKELRFFEQFKPLALTVFTAISFNNHSAAYCNLYMFKGRDKTIGLHLFYGRVCLTSDFVILALYLMRIQRKLYVYKLMWEGTNVDSQ